MDDFYLLLFIIYGGPALVGLAIAPKEKRILFGIITFFLYVVGLESHSIADRYMNHIIAYVWFIPLLFPIAIILRWQDYKAAKSEKLQVVDSSQREPEET